jgi:hypothetical protein
MLGTHVSGLQTSYGQIKTNQIRYAAVAASNDGFKPATLTAVAAAGSAGSA